MIFLPLDSDILALFLSIVCAYALKAERRLLHGESSAKKRFANKIQF
jgi:hypothetical protein